MRIKNKTHYSTRDIRRLALAVAKFEMVPRERLKTKYILVEYGNGGGRGSHDGDWVKLTIRKSVRVWRWETVTDHEVAACRYLGSISNVSRDGNFPPLHRHGKLVSVPHEPDPCAVAMVLAHEFAHNAAVSHRKMSGEYRWRRPEVWQWATEYPIRMKSSALPKPRPAADARFAAKLAHVQKMKARAETRVKRAATILKKWNRSARNYEKKLAACQNETGGGGAS